MKTAAIIACMLPALAWAQDTETNGLASVLDRMDELHADLVDLAHDAGMTRQDCLDGADPELGEMLYPGDPEAYRAIVEATCEAFD